MGRNSLGRGTRDLASCGWLGAPHGAGRVTGHLDSAHRTRGSPVREFLANLAATAPRRESVSLRETPGAAPARRGCQGRVGCSRLVLAACVRPCIAAIGMYTL